MGEGFVLVGPALMPNTERGLRDPHPFSLEQLSTSPASTHNLFWNLPPTRGPSQLSCQLSLCFSDFFFDTCAQGPVPQHQPGREQCGGDCELLVNKYRCAGLVLSEGCTQAHALPRLSAGF